MEYSSKHSIQNLLDTFDLKYPIRLTGGHVKRLQAKVSTFYFIENLVSFRQNTFLILNLKKWRKKIITIRLPTITILAIQNKSTKSL